MTNDQRKSWLRMAPCIATQFILFLVANYASAQSGSIRPDAFVIEVRDSQTQRPVPLVELETLAHQRFLTDSAGRAAVTDLDLMNRKVFFFVRSPGYEFPKDGFDQAGTALEVQGGKLASITVRRTNLAERITRMTGSGIFIESTRAGLAAPATELVPGDVIGCDSVMTAHYHDKIYWFWGDTLRPHYPTGGNFHITGATTALELRERIENGPPAFQYFTGKDKAIRPVANMPGEGPTWIGSVTVLPPSGNDAGKTIKPRMLANYVKVRKDMEVYRWGFVAWDDAAEQFTELTSTDMRPVMFPEGQTHTLIHKDADGESFIYFCNPLPLIRVRANEAAFLDETQYEGFTCLKPGTKLADHQLDRDAAGKLRFTWQRNSPPLTQKDQQALVKSGAMREDEARIVLKDTNSERRVLAHSGSVAWNKHRKRWIMIAVELGGEKSLLGNVWYAEAAELEGPWLKATQIAAHENYSFYNPKHHTFLDSDDGRIIYFEGTYTTTFSGNTFPTPRYEYNQLLYRLDLTNLPY